MDNMDNRSDFLIATSSIPDLLVDTNNEIQTFHGSWYRGDNLNFIPSKSLLKSADALDKYVLKGYLPSQHIIDKQTVVTAFGSCFARNISEWLLGKGFNVLGKRLNLNSHIIRFGEGMVNTFAIREQLEWALDDKSLTEGLWFGENKEIALPDERVRLNTKNLLTQTKVLIITIGLSEIWFDKTSGRAFWRAIPSDKFDNKRHGFRLSTVEENTENLEAIANLVQKHIPDCKVVFTLSPIPLMATFRSINCISANTISKAILRISLDNLSYGDEYGRYYFPSYELVKEVFENPFKDDNRHVKPEYVMKIMELFGKHFCLQDETKNEG